MRDLRPLKDLKELFESPRAPCARVGDLAGTDGMLPPPLAAGESISNACKPLTDTKINFNTEIKKIISEGFIAP